MFSIAQYRFSNIEKKLPSLSLALLKTPQTIAIQMFTSSIIQYASEENRRDDDFYRNSSLETKLITGAVNFNYVMRRASV